MYVSLSKNEGESFAVSFSLCFLLRESHPDCDFEGGWREWMLLSHFPSNNVQQHPQTRKMSNVGCKPVRVQSFECKGTTLSLRFTNFLTTFFDFFFTTEGKGVKTVNRNLETTTFCCSVAVLQFSRSLSHTQKIVLYLYIYI